jgi:hypothetical protein
MSAICIGLATTPRRYQSLQSALPTLARQTRKPSQISIFLNEFPSIPPLPKLGDIPCVIVEGALADRGKFHGCDQWEGYWFAIDDDILYPPDYIERLIAALERDEHRSVIGVHGTILARPFTDFFSYMDSRIVLDFRASLETARRVHMLGTGTVAFHTKTFRPDLRAMPWANMADVFFAVQAKAAGVPLFAIDRPKRWLDDVSSEIDPDCIWMRKRRDPVLQGRMLEAIRSAAPWPPFDFLSDEIKNG